MRSPWAKQRLFQRDSQRKPTVTVHEVSRWGSDILLKTFESATLPLAFSV